MQHKVEETGTIMDEVKRVFQQYLPLSTACSSMYFTTESPNQVDFRPPPSPPPPPLLLLPTLPPSFRSTSCISTRYNSSWACSSVCWAGGTPNSGAWLIALNHHHQHVPGTHTLSPTPRYSSFLPSSFLSLVLSPDGAQQGSLWHAP